MNYIRNLPNRNETVTVWVEDESILMFFSSDLSILG
jgi:hypothetical protein